jgi:hypothetical protein
MVVLNQSIIEVDVPFVLGHTSKSEPSKTKAQTETRSFNPHEAELSSFIATETVFVERLDEKEKPKVNMAL